MVDLVSAVDGGDASARLVYIAYISTVKLSTMICTWSVSIARLPRAAQDAYSRVENRKLDNPRPKAVPMQQKNIHYPTGTGIPSRRSRSLALNSQIHFSSSHFCIRAPCSSRLGSLYRPAALRFSLPSIPPKILGFFARTYLELGVSSRRTNGPLPCSKRAR